MRTDKSAVVNCKCPVGELRSADAMEAVATGDIVATDGIRGALPFHPNGGTSLVEAVQRNLSAFEAQIAAITQSAAD